MRIEGKVDGKSRKGEGRCEKNCRNTVGNARCGVPPWRLSTDLNWFAIQQGTGRRPFPTRTFIGKVDRSEQNLEAELNDAWIT